MIRIGIIGAGGIARRHVDELSGLDDVTVSAVVDLQEETSKWVTDLTGAVFCRDVTSALSHIDAAYVLTPPRARVEAITVLAEAGKAILCEKPLAATVEDAQRIHEIVSAAGVPFMMGFMRRWHPAYASLHSVIDSGQLGRPLQFFRRRLGYLAQASGNWRVDPSQLCGLTVESASHDIDLLRWLGGDVVAASGEVVGSRADLPAYDDSMTATLRFSSGAIGMLQVSWSSLVSENQVGIIGDRAAAVISGAGMWSSETLQLSSLDRREQEPVTFPAEISDDEGYHGQTRAFIGLLSGDDHGLPGVDDGLATVEISHQVLSASHGH